MVKTGRLRVPFDDVKLTAAGVGVALIPDNVAPAELEPNNRHLKRPPGDGAGVVACQASSDRR
jgi:hypothetical protein